jgi:hypothetical protein
MKSCKITMLLLYCCVQTLYGIAQSNDARYREKADAIRQEVWNWNKPEFKQQSIPAEYANASKVIIARHLDVNADTKRRGLAFGYRELMLTEILREEVKLNDPSAISEYSELSYTQLEKKSGMLMDKTTVVYIGIKVIKPNGAVKEINADDIVLTQDQKKKKEAKIAVPDLQVGDIIDYFIARQTNMSQLEKIPPYLFLFYDDVPIMNCSMHLEAGRKYALEYRSYNGAPDFKTTKGDDDDNILDIAKKNIPAVTESSLWTAPYRQLPMVRLNIILGYKGMGASRYNMRKPGELYKNQDPDEYLEDKLSAIANTRLANRSYGYTKINFGLSKTANNYLKMINKNRKNMSEDSIARELFYLFRFNTFLDQSESKDIDDISSIINLPQLELDENKVTYFLGEFFKSEDLFSSMVYSTLNRGPRMKEMLGADDLNNIILVRGNSSPLYGFPNIFATPQYVPSYFENIKGAVTVDTKSPKATSIKEFDRGTTNIPASGPDDNARIEKLDVSLSSEAAFLQVKRQSTLKGHYKIDEQQRLILFEDYYNSERKYFNEDKTLLEKLSEKRSTKKFAEELEAAFAEARVKNKESFVEEAKSFFGLEVKDMNNYKVDNLGVRHTSPDMIYSSDFKLGGLVKKAGTSYIIDIGKLEGEQLKLESNQRSRSLDVYAPYARSLQYEINFAIPDGYTAEGVNELNKNINNSTGVFRCEVKATDKMITIKVRKSYNSAFEPVANWNNMMAFIDAASDWRNSKIVLKKKA